MIEQIDERFAETYYAIREQAIREVIDWIDWLQSDESQREALGAAGNVAWYEFQDDPVGCLSHRVAYFARGEEDEMGGRIPAADLPPPYMRCLMKTASCLLITAIQSFSRSLALQKNAEMTRRSGTMRS